MTIILTIVVSLFASNLIGYFIHKALHKKWSGPFYKGHMYHHLVMYPANNLVSETYRSPVWYNRGVALFTPAFICIVLFLSFLAFVLNFSMWIVFVICLTILVHGIFNDYIHDCFHKKNQWLEKSKFYLYMRRAHFIHHIDMTKNFSIVTPEWDMIFKTNFRRTK